MQFSVQLTKINRNCNEGTSFSFDSLTHKHTIECDVLRKIFSVYDCVCTAFGKIKINSEDYFWK